MPTALPAAVRRSGALDPAAELDIVAHLGALEFPGVAKGQPLLGKLLLPAVLDHLLEQPVVITNAVAAGRNAEACHALQKARCKPPEAAIAERRIGLGAAHAPRVDPE